MSEPTLVELCIVACSEAFRGNGEIVYFCNGGGNDGQVEVFIMDPAGSGSVRCSRTHASPT